MFSSTIFFAKVISYLCCSHNNLPLNFIQFKNIEGYTFHILAHLDHLEDSWGLETRRCSAAYFANFMLLCTLQEPSMSSPQSSIRLYGHFFVKVTCLFKVSRATQQPVYMMNISQMKNQHYQNQDIPTLGHHEPKVGKHSRNYRSPTKKI